MEEGEIPVVESAAKVETEEPSSGSIRKRKRAVLFGYSGTGFSGLQTQAGGIFHTAEETEAGDASGNVETPDTIEDALHRALCAAGAIRETNQESFQKISWSRSARTDRGVHAASQVIAAKLEVAGEVASERGGDVSRKDEERFVEKVNEHLPPQIRVYRVFRVMNKFNARTATTSRTYGYFLPRFVLKREEDGSFPSLFDIRQCLKAFVGSHCFHNFTEKLTAKDPRSRRIIESFICSEPIDVDGEQVYRMQVKGQSFLKHHIRRMIGFTVELLRRPGLSCDKLIEDALSKEKVVEGGDGLMPMAPAEALFLDIASFEQYNQQIKKPSPASSTGKNQGEEEEEEGLRESIDFVGDATVRMAREKLISEVILPAIFDKTDSSAHKAFERYLEESNTRSFPPIFKNPNIPPELADAQEFLRIVERDRAKRLKGEEHSYQ